MKRQRERRSFTVEVKSRNRATPSPIEATSASPTMGAGMWAETSLVHEMSRAADHARDRSETRAPEQAKSQGDEKTPPAGKGVEIDKLAEFGQPSRRILPNLMAPEPDAVEEPVASAPEPRLFRVKRVIRRAAAAAKAEPAAIAPPPIWVAPSTWAASVGEAPAPAPAAPSRVSRARSRKEAPALRAGERWKRRLPRACW